MWEPAWWTLATVTDIHGDRRTSAVPRVAADTELIRRLEADWRDLVGSRGFRDQLRVWAVEDTRLAFDDGDALVAAAQRRDASDWHRRDQVLAALLARVPTDALARRVALQVVLPGVKSLIDGVRGWDPEERASRVVAEAVEVLAHCAQAEADTAPGFRVYANTRRRVLRAAVRDRSEPVTPVEEVPQVVSASTHGEADETASLRELVDWVQSRAGVRREAACEVVMTRTGQVGVEELAAKLGVDPQTLRRRRLRAEQRLRSALTLER